MTFTIIGGLPYYVAPDGTVFTVSLGGAVLHDRPQDEQEAGRPAERGIGTGKGRERVEHPGQDRQEER